MASSTRNADAISAVVNPPTARKVSASWDGGDNDPVAAEEQQRQRVVALAALVEERLGLGDVGLAPPARRLAARDVDQAPRRDRDQPARGRRGKPVARPLHRGREQRLLHGLLALVERHPPVAPHERGEDPRRGVAQRRLDRARRGGRAAHRPSSADPITARTSIAPRSMPGQAAAISIARSSLATSTLT